MRSYKVLCVLLIIIMNSILSPINYCVEITTSQRDTNLNFEIDWIPNNNLIIINNTINMASLQISYNGPVFYSNLEIQWPFNIQGNFSRLNDIRIGYKITTIINISFIAILSNYNTIEMSNVIARIYNNSYNLETSDTLYLTILLPISGKFENPIDTKSLSNINYFNSNIDSFSMSGIVGEGIPIIIPITLKNFYSNNSIIGYFGLSITYNYINQQIPLQKVIINQSLITLSLNESKLIQINIPSIDSNRFSYANIQLIISNDITFKDYSSIFFIRYENDNIIGGCPMIAQLFIATGLKISLDIKSGQILDNQEISQVDFYRNTTFTVKIQNFNHNNYKLLPVICNDKVSLLTSFSNRLYDKEIKFNIDVEKYNTVNNEFNYTPKISGFHHMYCTIIQNGDEINSNILSIFFRTNLKFSYNKQNEKIYGVQNRQGITINILDFDDQTVGNEETFQIKILSNQSTNDFDFSIIPSDDLGIIMGNGINPTKLVYNGNNHLSRDDFINSISTNYQQEGVFTIITLKVQYRLSGYYVIIPFIRIDSRILIFDANFENQTYRKCLTCKLYPLDLQCDTYKTIKVESRMKTDSIIIISGIIGTIFFYINYNFIQLFFKRISFSKRGKKKQLFLDRKFSMKPLRPE
jgi:hypothetical protein